MTRTETNRERIYSVSLSVLVYVDPDGLPPEGSDEFREIMAEHVLDFMRHAIDGPAELAEVCIDATEIVDEYDLSVSLATGRNA